MPNPLILKFGKAPTETNHLSWDQFEKLHTALRLAAEGMRKPATRWNGDTITVQWKPNTNITFQVVPKKIFLTCKLYQTEIIKLQVVFDEDTSSAMILVETTGWDSKLTADRFAEFNHWFNCIATHITQHRIKLYNMTLGWCTATMHDFVGQHPLVVLNHHQRSKPWITVVDDTDQSKWFMPLESFNPNGIRVAALSDIQPHPTMVHACNFGKESQVRNRISKFKLDHVDGNTMVSKDWIDLTSNDDDHFSVILAMNHMEHNRFADGRRIRFIMTPEAAAKWSSYPQEVRELVEPLFDNSVEEYRFWLRKRDSVVLRPVLLQH